MTSCPTNQEAIAALTEGAAIALIGLEETEDKREHDRLLHAANQQTAAALLLTDVVSTEESELYSSVAISVEEQKRVRHDRPAAGNSEAQQSLQSPTSCMPVPGSCCFLEENTESDLQRLEKLAASAGQTVVFDCLGGALPDKPSLSRATQEVLTRWWKHWREKRPQDVINFVVTANVSHYVHQHVLRLRLLPLPDAE